MIEIGMKPAPGRLPSLPHGVAILAGAGASAWLSTFAVVDWSRISSQAVGALGVAGLVGGSVVGAIVFAIQKYDRIQIDRKKLYDDANKESLSEQLEQMKAANQAASAESLKNQGMMRESLHALRNEASLAKGENFELRENLSTLRDQFLQVSKDLRETDRLLHASNDKLREMTVKLQETTDLLQTTARDRDALRIELTTLRAEILSFRSTQASHGADIKALLQAAPPGSGEVPVVPSPEAPR